jgi:hypothetical protein
MIYQKQHIFVSLRDELFCHAQVAREHLKIIYQQPILLRVERYSHVKTREPLKMTYQQTIFLRVKI